MKSINHPNVVNLIDVMVSKTAVYLVLELVTGGELFAKLGTPVYAVHLLGKYDLMCTATSSQRRLL